MERDAIHRSGPSDFKLGDWWVRPERNELERSGETVRVEARSMAVLECLALHASGVVDKERLIREVWSDSPYVGDDVLSHAVWELRKALGDSARKPAYIQTVPRKGYRLVAEILRPQGSPLPMAGVQIDHYDLSEELGRGAMGVVYEAVDRRLGRAVAIKFLAPELTRDPQACRRFEREARLAASLEHPNLATVHEIGETSEGHRYLVGAYYRGGSLRDRLVAGPMDVPEVLRLIRQLVAGLGAAHARGIIHRDVKPANLLLDDHGTLKICDFGIAKLLGATDLTRTGTPLGTPAYKSPEQTRGGEVDHRTDLWSAGVVCFELLTGRRPFDGELEQAVAHAILAREPEVLEDAGGRPVPEPLRRFVARAMAKDPTERYQSAEEMTAALNELEAEPPRPGGSWRWKALAAAIFGILVALGILSYWQRASEEPPPMSGQPEHIEAVRNHLDDGRRLWLRGNHPANLNEVRRHFEEAVALLPSSADGLGHLAVFRAEQYSLDRKQKDRDASHELARRAQTADSSSALARVAEARIILRDEEWTAAERLAREAIEIRPECDRNELCDLAYLALADALWGQERFEEALEALDRGAPQGGGWVRCRLRKALFYDGFGDREAAEEEYEQVLSRDPVQTTALHELSTLLLTAERYKEAVPRLRLLYVQTRNPRTLNNLGMALYGLARYRRVRWSEVVSTYQRAHEGFESAGVMMPTPLVAIGDAYMEQGQPEVAKDWYRQALAKFEALENPGVWRRGQHAVCRAKLGRFSEAEEEIEGLLAGADDASSTIVYAARIYALKSDRDRLLELARRWQKAGQDSTRFLDDAAFIGYRADLEYLRILDPQLHSSE